MLSFTIQLLEIKGGFCLVEVRRGKGDILDFNKFYREFVENCELAFVPEK